MRMTRHSFTEDRAALFHKQIGHTEKFQITKKKSFDGHHDNNIKYLTKYYEKC